MDVAERRAPGSDGDDNSDGGGADASGPSWHRGVRVVTTTKLTTTGGTVWGAARAALEFFEACPNAAGLATPGARILELGAGCGLLGLALARRLPAAGEVCLTEQGYGGALAHLRLNVAANRGMPGFGRVTTADCDWVKVLGNEQEEEEERGAGAGGCESVAKTPAEAEAAADTSVETGNAAADEGAAAADAARLLGTRWDYIIGSDLVYDRAGTHMLPRVMRRLALAGRGGERCGACGGLARGQETGAGGSDSTSQPPTTAAAASAAAATIYYAHTKHRYDARDVEFLERCAAEGLNVEEVAPPGAPPRAPSPPPFTELYPEMRVAVWRITVADGGGNGCACGSNK